MLINKSVSHRIIKVNSLLCKHLCTRAFQTKVVISKSTCPYINLAYEDFIYENETFLDNQKTLFIWRNRSSVIIGRHQNPWKEVNLRRLKENNINICRRMSGGGSVYHDLGNVNFTFFTSKANYNRKENLNFIINTLKNDFDICLERNNKDDMILENRYKVSGTAAKLGLKTCYHHCTLLCDSNLDNLSGLLTNPFGLDITTNATESVKSETRNLFSKNCLNFEKIIDSFSSSFFKQYSTSIKSQSFDLVDPKLIDKVSDKAETLQRWGWIYGKSPKFSIHCDLTYDSDKKVNIKLTIHKGKIDDFGLFDEENHEDILYILSELQGLEFRESQILPALLELARNEKYFPICLQLSKWFEDASITD